MLNLCKQTNKHHCHEDSLLILLATSYSLKIYIKKYTFSNDWLLLEWSVYCTYFIMIFEIPISGVELQMGSVCKSYIYVASLVLVKDSRKQTSRV